MTRCGHTRAAGSQIGHGKGSRGWRTPLDRTDHPPSQTARPHPGDKEGMAFGSTITGSDYVPGLLGSFRSVRLFTVWAQSATEAPHSLLFQRLQVSHTT